MNLKENIISGLPQNLHKKTLLLFTVLFVLWIAGKAQSENSFNIILSDSLNPRIITDTVKWDTDDPAIWINKKHPRKSLIIGTDKNQDGALYAFNLKGKIVKTFRGLDRPNNVDIAYGFKFNGEKFDIAVVTERLKQRIRVFRLPELVPIDMGDLVVFDGDTERAPMGIALYKRPSDNAFFVFVSGKSGPSEGYIGQYRLEESVPGKLTIQLVRQFGKYSGKREIESIAVDNEMGFVYYSDETVGVRQYHANPDVEDADKELALFATQGFTRDHEGISIYKLNDGKGYILVSDQQANKFWIYTRNGTQQNPYEHKLVKIISTKTLESDGSDVTSFPLSKKFPTGLFVAMSADKTYHFYSWDDIAKNDLLKSNKKRKDE
ncbi:MAG: phytase [Prolixibacteraceae bacterium]|nr:phytase [Prolixibacteraceae bacterium]